MSAVATNDGTVEETLTPDEYEAKIRRCLTPATHVADKLCEGLECWSCGERDCPHDSGEHYWHDGCVMCSAFGRYRIWGAPKIPLKKQKDTDSVQEKARKKKVAPKRKRQPKSKGPRVAKPRAPKKVPRVKKATKST